MDALGYPLRYILTGGERHDVTQAEALLEPLEFERAIGDKGYDSADLIAFIEAKEADPVIPSRTNRVEAREYDKHVYKERHLVECFINKIKWYRRIFTRYDKLARRYMAFLHLAGAFIWLR